MNQRDSVISVMENNGGYSTLGYLYQNVDVKEWQTKTPFASIRRIVQSEKYFFKIRPGLWALNHQKEKVLRIFNLDGTRKETENAFDHTYYQGLIVEIGNLKQYATYIPNQDKNRLFLGKPLKQVSSIGDIYDFSYPNVVKRAKTVDVIWFNCRKLPCAFFEIEYSTDFQNSLAKYADLQDYHSKFYLVSPIEKKRQYENVVNYDVFKEIKDRVNFLSFDQISNWHTKTIEMAELQKDIGV